MGNVGGFEIFMCVAAFGVMGFIALVIFLALVKDSIPRKDDDDLVETPHYVGQRVTGIVTPPSELYYTTTKGKLRRSSAMITCVIFCIVAPIFVVVGVIVFIVVFG